MFCLYLPVLVPASSIILHSLDVFKVLFLFGFCFSRANCLISSQKTGLLSVFIIIILLYSHSSFDSFFLNSLNQNCVFYSRWTCAFLITIVLHILRGRKSTHLLWSFLGLLCCFVILHLLFWNFFYSHLEGHLPLEWHFHPVASHDVFHHTEDIVSSAVFCRCFSS